MGFLCQNNVGRVSTNNRVINQNWIPVAILQLVNVSLKIKYPYVVSWKVMSHVATWYVLQLHCNEEWRFAVITNYTQFKSCISFEQDLLFDLDRTYYT